MLTVADRAELPGSFCSEPLTAQTRSHGFHVKRPPLLMKFIRQPGSTVTLLCAGECFPDGAVAATPELLMGADDREPFMPGILNSCA